jgi:dextranase
MPIDYATGFARFADAAHAALKKPVLLNNVGGYGQSAMAASSVDFVYTELWPEDHATYASSLKASDDIHAVSPDKAVVFAAYLHEALADRLREGTNSQKPLSFNTPAVLLADAVMFASGAAHIELGDGDRMLSHPYFPADAAIIPSSDLRDRLRCYYDFLVSYENYLRDGVKPAPNSIMLSGAAQSQDGTPGTVWTIARQKGRDTILHLINFSGLKKPEWRDDALDAPPAQALSNLKLTVPQDVQSAGWASPDVEEGAWHELTIQHNQAGVPQITLPKLQYWSVVIFRRSSAGL